MIIERGTIPPDELYQFLIVAAINALLCLAIVGFCGLHIPVAFDADYSGPRKGGPMEPIVATSWAALGVIVYGLLPYLLPRRGWSQWVLGVLMVLVMPPLCCTVVGWVTGALALYLIRAPGVGDYFCHDYP